MEIRIGVTWSNRELELELGEDADADKLAKDVEAGLAKGGVLWFTDRRGRRVGVPADKVAYIELGRDAAERKVGFGLS
jgi:hypothetical protein